MIRRLYEQAKREMFPEPPTIRREPIRRTPQPPPRASVREPAAPPRRPPPPQGTESASGFRRALRRELATTDGLRRAFLLSEILGPPVSLRPPRDEAGRS